MTEPAPQEPGTKPCPACGNRLETWAHICPDCEYEWPEDPEPEPPIAGSRIVGFCLAASVCLLLVLFSPTPTVIFAGMSLGWTRLILFENPPKKAWRVKDLLVLLLAFLLALALYLLVSVALRRWPQLDTDRHGLQFLKLLMIVIWSTDIAWRWHRHRSAIRRQG